MENADEDEYEYDEYDARADPKYDAKQEAKHDSKDIKQPLAENAGNRNTLDSRSSAGRNGDQSASDDVDYPVEKAENERTDRPEEEKLEEDVRAYKDVYFRNDEHSLSDKYDAINRYQLPDNLKYDNNKNYERIPNNYELIDDADYDTKNDQSRDVNDALDEKHRLKHLDTGKYELVDGEPFRDRARATPNNRPNEPSKEPPADEPQEQYRPRPKQSKPKLKKNQVKLIKEIKYPKSLVSRPRYYYPGRNFVHQRPSTSKKENKKLSKIQVKANKFMNDDIATLIPLELYKHRVKSRFVSNSEFSNGANKRNGYSSRLEELEMPQILNGELYCDCGFYLKLKNKKISKLNSKLKRVSNEQKQMRRKLVEMAVKENQLQLICRSQSKANLKYINKNDGRPGYLALSNSSAISNPIDLI